MIEFLSQSTESFNTESPKVSGTKNGGTVPYKAILGGEVSLTYAVSIQLI